MDVESRREKEGLRCGYEGLLRGGRWVGDPVKGAHAITSGQTQPRTCAFISTGTLMKGGLVGWGKPCPLGTVKGPEGVSPGEEKALGP